MRLNKDVVFFKHITTNKETIMEPTSIILFTSGVSCIFTIISGFALHLIRRQAEKTDKLEEQLKKLSESVVQLNNTAVSDSHVRNVVREEIQQLSLNIDMMMGSVKSIELFVAEQRGFQAAQQMFARRKKDLPDVEN